MKCPKCSFDQPDDRFCANCGVDVALYVPRTNFVGSFFKSALFFAVFATLVVGVAIWFLLTQRSQVVHSTLPPVAGPTSVFRKTPPPVPKVNEAPVNKITEGGAASVEEAQEVVAETPPEPTSPATPPPAVAPPPPAETLKPRATTFRVTALEVDNEYEQTLLGISSDSRLSVGLPREEIGGLDFTTRLKNGADRGAISKISTSTQTISNDEQNPNGFSFVSADSRINGEVGLMFQLKASQQNENSTTVMIEGRRIIGREDAAQPDILNFQQEINIPLKLPAYMVGLVRGRNAVDPTEMAVFTANQIFSIFRSDKFRSNQSSLVLLVEAVEHP